MIEDKRAALLEVRNLSVSFSTPYGEAEAVRDVSFSLKPGETLALVGESGCGKSVLCKSIMKLLPSNGKIKAGNIFVQGIDITDYREQDMQRLRGKLFSMVFQDPMTSLNPAMTVGAQIAEAVKVCRPGISRTGLQEKVIELLQLVGIERPEERRKMYPHQFSGGMRQRSVLAVALAGNPAVLFADEKRAYGSSGTSPGAASGRLGFLARGWILLLCAGVAAMVWVAMYLAFTPVGSDYIQGVQARYYIPLLLPLYLCLCPDEARLFVRKEKVYLAAVAGGALFTGMAVGMAALSMCG